GWRGKADFLVRVAVPTALGAWGYEAWDTKLARHARPSHVLQLVYYTDRVAALQQRDPESMWVVLGTGDGVEFKFHDFSSYFRAVRRRFLRAIGDGADASPYPVAHCNLCGYLDNCEEEWQRADHLSLIAGIRRSQAERLINAGVATCADLASCEGRAEGVG